MTLMKSFPLLASAIALSLSLGAALPAFSQAASNTQPGSSAPAQRGQMRRPDFLNLTAEQQAQMEQIHQNERSQIDAILTPEQRAQLQQNFQNRGQRPVEGNQSSRPTGEGRGMHRSPFDSLNLTAEQRTQIEAIRQATRTQMDAILTPEQRQQIQQNQQQHQQRGQAGAQNTQTR